MQLYAINQKNQIVFANAAEKHLDYQCIECKKRVRLRGGFHRQNHFYHIEPNQHCNLHGKGMVHLQIQLYLQSLLSSECQLEYRFPEINRIADVAWIPHNLIFEIQCSPIFAEEVRKRNHDYNKLGWQVIWILHDKRFNKWRLSAAEYFLRASGYYFTNMTANGQGIIYDQYDFVEGGFRRQKLEPLAINLSSYTLVDQKKLHINFLKEVKNRMLQRKIYFNGDLIDLTLRKRCEDYLLKAQQIEKALEKKIVSTNWIDQLRSIFYYIIIRPYYLLFQIILERMAR